MNREFAALPLEVLQFLLHTDPRGSAHARLCYQQRRALFFLAILCHCQGTPYLVVGYF